MIIQCFDDLLMFYDFNTKFIVCIIKFKKISIKLTRYIVPNLNFTITLFNEKKNNIIASM